MLTFRHIVRLCVAFDSYNKQLIFLCIVFSLMSGNFVCTVDLSLCFGMPLWHSEGQQCLFISVFKG